MLDRALIVMLICLEIVSAGCGSTRAATEIGAGHPASVDSASVLFTAPADLFTGAIEPGAEPDPGVPGAAVSGGLTVYTCPMHEDVRSDRPGECPKCGMDLKRADAPTSHDHGGER